MENLQNIQQSNINRNTLVSVLIPCYASEQYLRDTVDGIRNVFEASAFTDVEKTHRTYDYQIILVNDCSPDGTGNVIKALCAEDPGITGIYLDHNIGQARALIQGYDHVSGDYLICMDDDGQHPPEEIFKLIDKLDEGYGLVYAQHPKLQESPLRCLASKVTDIMLTVLARKPRGVRITSYIALDRRAVDILQSLREYYPLLTQTLRPYHVKVGTVTVDHQKREQGTSNYTLKKLFGLWFETIFNKKMTR